MNGPLHDDARATFGLARLRTGIVAHPIEGPIVQLAFNLFVEHRRKKTTARLLNDRGHRTRNGAKFTDTTVGRLLSNPAYKQVGIVSLDVWKQVQAILEGQKLSPPASRTARHLFSGLLRCACGTPMYPKPPNSKYLCRGCKRKILNDDLEAIVAHELAPYVSVTDLAERWSHLALGAKREIVEASIREIVVSDGIELHLSI